MYLTGNCYERYRVSGRYCRCLRQDAGPSIVSLYITCQIDLVLFRLTAAALRELQNLPREHPLTKLQSQLLPNDPIDNCQHALEQNPLASHPRNCTPFGRRTKNTRNSLGPNICNSGNSRLQATYCPLWTRWHLCQRSGKNHHIRETP